MSSYSDLLHEAMKVQTQQEADSIFERLSLLCRQEKRMDKAEAERIQRSNLGYFAGYYDHETRERVERLYKTEHPIFGSIAKNGPPTALEAFNLGKKLGEGK